MRPVIETLQNKGFNGADIHFFLQRFNIGIWIAMPYQPPLICYTTEAEVQLKLEEQKKEAEDFYQAQVNEHKRKWEEAAIAANFEIPK